MQPSEILLRDWAIQKLKEVGLTPDADALISITTDEESTEGGCYTCGPFIEYFIVIQVNGHDTLRLEGNLWDFLSEIMKTVPAHEEEAMAKEVEDLVYA